jgi:hypothetical protein
MGINWRHIIRVTPVYLFLLPLFFVLHGVMENYDFVPLKNAAGLVLIYLFACAVLSLLFRLLFRNYRRANFMAFLLMAFFLFFGGIHDFLKKLFPGSFFVQYSFLLPFAGLLAITIIILLTRKKPSLMRATFYLNTLFIILIVVDTACLLIKMTGNKKSIPSGLPAGMTPCNNCPRPDIYLVLADEYAGNGELKDIFQFDDSLFIHQLNTRGFRVIPGSYSNYNYTPFSLASLLNMRYLDLEGRNRTQSDLAYCYQNIQDNQLLQFLQYHGYTLYNYSVFDFHGQPARTNETFLPAKTRLITSQTLYNRLYRDIGFNLITRFRSKAMIRRATYLNLRNNNHLFDLTWKLAGEKPGSPKFVYTHLMMPHYPYYFDRDGKEQPFDSITEGNQHHKTSYIGYLQYANKKLLALIDHILESSANPPIIILMGDHGFRHFREPVPEKYHFLNLMSVYMPSGNYTQFPDSSSAVNLFRSVLNSGFNQELPFLRDSTTYLRD